jgi:hypothetical protein
MVLGWSDYRWAHEPCFYAAKQGHKPEYYGDGTDTTIWRFAAADGNGDRGTTIGTGLTITLPNGRELYVAAAPPKGKKTRHIRIEADQPIRISGNEAVDDIWEVGRDAGHGKRNALHPNQKPVELVRRAIRNSSLEGQGVIDVFGGSGSTLMGAEQAGRCAYLSEYDPANVDIIVRRWQDFTQREAIHETEKTTFAKLEAERKG